MKKKRTVVDHKKNIGHVSEKRTRRRSKPFPIVAIGASAGGIEAITELLRNLSPDTGMAYVYIQHLDPHHPSMLSAILAKTTKMEVVEAKEMMRIEQDHVYIIPPNKEMFIADGVLTLNPRPVRPAISMPINQFFLSLADKQKEGAIGIILSGNASDGALGLRAIKNEGGFTLAQDASAKFQSMPRAAIAEGVVDLVLSPKEIAIELSRMKDHVSLMNNIDHGKKKTDQLSAEKSINAILQLIKRNLNVDFTQYKPTTIHRRIIRRMLLHKMKSPKEYFAYLSRSKTELNLLYSDMLINVTHFFRDPDSVNYLKKVVLPGLIKVKGGNEPLRIWVPACSTGEEAYSIAILIAEVMNGKNTRTIQIFASDLSEAAITKARAGLYSKADLANVSDKRISQFFIQEDGSYRIVKSIRDLCVFAPHNVLKDPPFSRMHLISCCNLLIYLNEPLQKKLLTTFHYSLHPGGILVLGKSESVSASGGLFTRLEKKIKIYSRKKENSGRSVFEAGISPRIHDKPYDDYVTVSVGEDKRSTDGIEKKVDEILLKSYVPASVVINKEMDILQFRGSTSLFLEPAPGKASLNLFKMARTGLGFELRNAVHKVFKQGKPVKKEGIEITYKNTRQSVSIEVLPIKDNIDEELYLIVFEESTLPASPAGEIPNAKDKKVNQLEEELMAAREDMRAIIEEQEASNEELQSANEEIVSSNEELQSINEELETSKEEIESTNEELMTINSELQIRNDQLSEAYDYADSVLATLREAILVLDKDLRVIRANNTFYQIFQCDPGQTEGVLIYELGNGQWNIPALRKLFEDIVPGNTYFNNYEVRHVFPSIGEKIMMVNARRLTQKISKVRLILVAIEDITLHITVQKILTESQQRIQNILEGLPQMAVVTNAMGKREFFNRAWYEYTGQTENEAIETGAKAVIHPDELNDAERLWARHLKSGQPIRHEFRYRRKDGMYRWHMVQTNPIKDSSGKVTAWISTCTDIHDAKESEARVRAVLAGLPQMAWTTDAKGNLTFVNKTLMEYSGFTEQAFRSQKRVGATHPDDYRKMLPLWKHHVVEGKPYQTEIRYKRASDNEYRWHLVKIVPVLDGEGNTILWVGTATEIHDQKIFADELEKKVQQRTEALNKTNLNLQRSNEELSQFAYVASHDLQEPLRKIQTFSDRLLNLKINLQGDAGIYLEKIGQSAERMKRLIEDVLSFSQLVNKQEQYVKVDLKMIVEEVIREMDLQGSEENIKIEIDQLPVIHASPIEMKQLFFNIIHNSHKFSSPGKPLHVKISSHPLSADKVKKILRPEPSKRYYQITISDNGVGFDQQFAEQIFTIFQRLPNKKDVPGTGIGLAICKKIVNNHGGEIYAESKISKGTSIHLILPT